MIRKMMFILAILTITIASVALAQITPFNLVTQEMLQNPSPNDWLMYSRTYDAQRFSPLNQITKQNVNQLKQVWSKDMVTGTQESIPLVHDGVMYVMNPGAPGTPAGGVLWALDATNGKLLWEYRRPGGASNSKAFAMYLDLIFYPATDGAIVALDMRTGQVRWETKAVNNGGRLSSGLFMAGDKIISGRTCGTPPQQGCYIAAHDAKTGSELWRFYTAAGDEDPKGEPVLGRCAYSEPLGLHLGPHRQLRPGEENHLLGCGQSNAEHAFCPSWRQFECDRSFSACGSLQQFDSCVESGNRQAAVVLPAPAGRRLGSGLHE